MTRNQLTLSPDEALQYAVKTSQSTSQETTSWDKREYFIVIEILLSTRSGHLPIPRPPQNILLSCGFGLAESMIILTFVLIFIYLFIYLSIYLFIFLTRPLGRAWKITDGLAYLSWNSWGRLVASLFLVFTWHQKKPKLKILIFYLYQVKAIFKHMSVGLSSAL